MIPSKEFKIELIRSSRRKKTVQAKLVNDILKIYLPEGLSEKEEKKWIKQMREYFLKKNKLIGDNKALRERADRLNKKYFNGKLKFDIKYVNNQNKKFGSCTPKTGVIRISDRVSKMPSWVQDYVILHELTHIIHPNHSKKFWEQVDKYRYAERAKGYLIAVDMNRDNEDQKDSLATN